MESPQKSPEEITRIGEEIYQHELKQHIDELAALGRLISIDVETREYEIAEDDLIEAALRLRSNRTGALVYSRRIGYGAAETLGGSLEAGDEH